MDGIKMEDYIDVVYKCKFCSHTCTSSSEMGNHVREVHLQTKPASQSNIVFSTESGNGKSYNIISIVFIYRNW